MTVLSDLERTGQKFSLTQLMEVRARTRAAVGMIADQVEVGMAEEDAKAMARRPSPLGKCAGDGTTSSSVSDPTRPRVHGTVRARCHPRPDDIFFVDIGPIFGGYEGDGGDTFVFGSDPEHHRAKRDAKRSGTRSGKVVRQGKTGQDLYEFAVRPPKLRLKLNLDLSGHRLSEYPHSAHYDGPSLRSSSGPSPTAGSSRSRSSIRPAVRRLLEDLLLEDQSFPEPLISD